MNDYDALFQTVLENPDDDAPRLVLADYLQEQDMTERAEFIRLQCRRATLPEWEWEHQELLSREQYLLSRYSRVWRAKLPNPSQDQWGGRAFEWGEFERGFIQSAQINNYQISDIENWAKTGIVVLTKLGIDRDYDPDVDSETALQWSFPTVKRLTCDHSCLVNLHKRFPHLEEVEFRGVYMQADEVDWVEELPAVPKISCRGEGGVVLVRHMIENGWKNKLTHLALLDSYLYHDYESQERLISDEVQSLIDLPGIKNLQSLKITGARLDEETFIHILTSKHLSNLRELVLKNNNINIPSSLLLKKMPSFTLDQFDMSGNTLYSTVIRILNWDAFAQLKVLQLESCEQKAKSLEYLIESPCWHTLRVLNLSRNHLGSEGMDLLASAPRPTCLHTLKLDDCDLGNLGVQKLGQIPWLDQIRELSLFRNQIGDEGLQDFCKGKAKSLHTLGLGENLLGSKFQAALNPLAKHLVKLDLSRNPNIALGWSTFVKQSTSFTQLQELNLESCRLDEKKFKELASGKPFPNLCCLSVAGNNLPPAKIQEVLRNPYPYVEIIFRYNY